MQINRFARVLAAVALGTSACFAASAPALAAGDPPGANGTVKIDAPVFDSKIHNEPHVTCEFRVKFFDFDANQYGNIVFSAQAPSGKFQEVLRLDNKLLSNDAATGGNPDPDEIYPFTADDLNLTGLTAQPQQGYHIKLTIELLGTPATDKHKVFWLEPCQSSTTPPPSCEKDCNPPCEKDCTPPCEKDCTPSTPPTCVPSTSDSFADSGDDCGSGGMSGGGGGSNDGGLPVTGVAASSIAVGGLALIGTGAVLMIRRRRKFVA